MHRRGFPQEGSRAVGQPGGAVQAPSLGASRNGSNDPEQPGLTSELALL